MGLADRDYMHEHQRERAESRGAVYAQKKIGRRFDRKSILWVIALIILGLAIGMLLGLVKRTAPGLMGPIRVTSTPDPQAVQPQQPEMAMASTPFPESGSVEWGPEGQPIGGNLERLDIWDVTQSSQNKVLHIRSAPDTVFATVYLQAGQRMTLVVPANRRYHVTASAGDIWEGQASLFGSSATTVDFGFVDIMPGTPGVIAMGAPDQTASVVSNDKF